MPIVRIDFLEGKAPAYGVEVGLIVARAMTDALNVPKDDLFQVITAHPKTGLHLIGIISESTVRTTAFFCRSR